MFVSGFFAGIAAGVCIGAFIAYRIMRLEP